jgi:hypothetical protein
MEGSVFVKPTAKIKEKSRLLRQPDGLCGGLVTTK